VHPFRIRQVLRPCCFLKSFSLSLSIPFFRSLLSLLSRKVSLPLPVPIGYFFFFPPSNLEAAFFPRVFVLAGTLTRTTSVLDTSFVVYYVVLPGPF